MNEEIRWELDQEKDSAMIENDPVHHPSHYTSGKFEVIDIIRDQLGLEGLKGFCKANALKYIMRSGKKESENSNKEIEDLEKAAWYLNHYIKTFKNEKENNNER